MALTLLATFITSLAGCYTEWVLKSRHALPFFAQVGAREHYDWKWQVILLVLSPNLPLDELIGPTVTDMSPPALQQRALPRRPMLSCAVESSKYLP